MQRNTWKRKGSAAETGPVATVEVHDSVEAVAPDAWNDLSGTTVPCLRHEYFAALEASGAVGDGTGWQPRYLVLESAGRKLLGVIPLFEKRDSRGEFIFDWSWATALEQAGRRYYPKLVAAVPYTPIPGPRLLLAPGAGVDEAGALADAALELAAELDVSSVHWLFANRDEVEMLSGRGHLARTGCHFEWRNPGVPDFDGWLAELTSARRKNIRRERRRIAEAGIDCSWARGGDLDASDVALVHRLYASTYLAHGLQPYLPREFFAELARRMPNEFAVCFARRGSAVVAAALYLEDDRTLYGRYWGAFEWVDSLHFELCYYQGIERALARGLERFHPGVQGEHKLLRGFAPTYHHSAHWLRDEDLRRAVAGYVRQERAAVREYVATAAEYLPFRHGGP